MFTGPLYFRTLLKVFESPKIKESFPFVIGIFARIFSSMIALSNPIIFISAIKSIYPEKVQSSLILSTLNKHTEVSEHYEMIQPLLNGINMGVMSEAGCPGVADPGAVIVKLAHEKGFQQVIWTDDATHTKMEESGTMNVFFRINDTLYTAPTSERILDGVTRKSLIAIAERDGIQLSVRSVLVAELVEAAKNGSLREIFGAGTAAVVTIIKGFSYQDVYYELPKIEDSMALQLKIKLTNIQQKLAVDTFGWTVKV